MTDDPPKTVRANERAMTGHWLVYLTIADEEVVPLCYAAPRVAGHFADVYDGRANDRAEEPPSVMLEVLGATGTEAERQAREVLDRMREVAGIRGGTSELITLSHLMTPGPSRFRFITEAQTLVDQRMFEMAVLAAQVHFECTFRDEVAAAVDRLASPYAALLLRSVRNWSLMGDAPRALVEELFGHSPTEAPAWNRYSAHVARRNRVAHHGEVVGEQEAVASLEAVVEMTRWLWGSRP